MIKRKKSDAYASLFEITRKTINLYFLSTGGIRLITMFTSESFDSKRLQRMPVRAHLQTTQEPNRAPVLIKHLSYVTGPIAVHVVVFTSARTRPNKSGLGTSRFLYTGINVYAHSTQTPPPPSINYS